MKVVVARVSIIVATPLVFAAMLVAAAWDAAEMTWKLLSDAWEVK